MSLAHRPPVLATAETRSGAASSSRRHATGTRSRAPRRLAVTGVLAVLGAGAGLLAGAGPASAEEAPSGAAGGAVLEIVVTDEGVVVDGVVVPGSGGPDGILIEPQSLADCLAGNVCAWTGTTYTGTLAHTTSTSATDTGFLSAGSLANKSTKAARVYSGTGGSGTWTCLNPGEQRTSVSIGAQSMRILTVTSC